MSTVRPRTMSGVMELLPREQVAFQRMLDTIRAAFERFGFVPIETPAIEYLDVLLTKSGGDTEKQIYFVQSKGAREQGADLEYGLRFDLTVPLARYVAEHEGQLTFPFRRYQIQRVYRGERKQKGRYREFYQCDIDVIGREQLPLTYDAEIPAVIAHLFTSLAFGPFTIRINNRKVLRGLLASLGVDDEGAQALVLREVDKLDKRGRDAVAAALADARFGLGPDGAARVLELVDLRGAAEPVLATLRSWQIGNETFARGVDELAEVARALADFGVADDAWCLDLSIARGLDYYTGTVYETVLDEHPELGSVCSGGRYDELATNYTKTSLPGVGISIGATRLFYKLMEAGLVAAAGSTVDVLVARQGPDLADDNRRLGAALREAGLRTEIVFEDRKLDKQFRYADRAGIRFVALVGPDELAREVVRLKDLVSGEQVELPRAEVGARVRALVDDATSA